LFGSKGSKGLKTPLNSFEVADVEANEAFLKIKDIIENKIKAHHKRQCGVLIMRLNEDHPRKCANLR